MPSPYGPNCPPCMEEGIAVTMNCIDGDETGLCYECPRCHKVAWMEHGYHGRDH